MPIEPIKLTPEDQRTLKELGPDIEALEREIAKAERAGIDVAKLREDLEKARTLREGILREYTT